MARRHLGSQSRRRRRHAATGRATRASPFVIGVLGNLAGGHLSDRLVRLYGLGRGRRFVGTSSLAIAAVLILISALTSGKAAAIVLLSPGFGAMDCMLPSAWAICLDLGKEHTGAVTGAMNTPPPSACQRASVFE